MAKWGEGDPRWIVEERPDATNVNNWHWTEKNASQWSKDKISELFLNLKLDDDIGCCEITEITSCEGEAVVNNRKAKLIFFYEWVIKMKWKGKIFKSILQSKMYLTTKDINFGKNGTIASWLVPHSIFVFISRIFVKYFQ
ncbi:activator of 90 kDa heat shock protein ATPase homolog 1-like [Centruroides sculpturatus]|uniref:activator of 90 kDa heat shock protein ATPase homolog 1-like n=1 Tax=Centruroides sculpturatus TaxID=218467 RepID=UPI000C6D6E5D|nr:activator of 90 kDa heat shock protein ATPase homolog 1-like [Centruroides sculpturatus]